MNHSDPVSRRKFIQTSGKTAAALVAGMVAAPAILRGVEATAKPVRVGQIGLGVKGGQHIRAAGSRPSCKVVGVCDVYKPHLQKGVKFSNNPDVKSYLDYKELLNDPQIEAVIIATPGGPLRSPRPSGCARR